jgi:hypothetical protein
MHTSCKQWWSNYYARKPVQELIGVATILKYSDTQPRDNHGRFTDGGGGSSSVKIDRVGSYDDEVLDKWTNQIESGWHGLREEVGWNALNNVNESDHLATIVEGGKIKAVSSFHFTGSNRLEIDYFATGKKGYARGLITAIASVAVKRGKTITLEALEKAIPFYEKMGFKADYDRAWHAMRLDVGGCRKLIGKSVDDDLEPEDGCFVSSRKRIVATPKIGISAIWKYSPDQPRDDHGRWTADGSGDEYLHDRSPDMQRAIQFGLEGAHEAAHKFAVASTKSGMEVAYIIDDQATVIRLDGEKGRVRIPGDLLQVTTHMVHTHPSDCTFSDKDIAILMRHWNIEQTQVVTPSGMLFTMTKGKSWKGKGDAECEKAAESMERYWEKMLKASIPAMHARCTKGENASELSRELIASLVNKVTGKFDLIYAVGTVGGKKKEYLQHKSASGGDVWIDDTILLRLPGMIEKGEVE